MFKDVLLYGSQNAIPVICLPLVTDNAFLYFFLRGFRGILSVVWRVLKLEKKWKYKKLVTDVLSTYDNKLSERKTSLLYSLKDILSYSRHVILT